MLNFRVTLSFTKFFIALFEVTIFAIVVNTDFVKYLPFPEVVTTFISPKEVLESRPLDRPFECFIKTVVYEYVLTLYFFRANPPFWYPEIVLLSKVSLTKSSLRNLVMWYVTILSIRNVGRAEFDNIKKKTNLNKLEFGGLILPELLHKNGYVIISIDPPTTLPTPAPNPSPTSRPTSHPTTGRREHFLFFFSNCYTLWSPLTQRCINLTFGKI